jgi:hypothetical protein
MRVRPRLLRRFRIPRAPSVYAGEDAAAPHVRLLTERLVPDDAWIEQLAAGPADARAGGFDTLANLHRFDDLDGLDEFGDIDDVEEVDEAAADVVVELRPGGRFPGHSIETAPADGEPLTTVEALEQSGARHLPARSVERLVYELALRNEIVAQRVERIERRLDDIADQVFEAATQCDLIELEARRARLAAEVARLAVELRGEIDSGLTRLAREMADRVAQHGEVDAAPPSPISPLISLSDLAALDTLPGDVLGRPGPFATSTG